MRVRHLWYHAGRKRGGGWRAAFVASRLCNPQATLARLSALPQPELGWFSRAVAWLTTPFKFLGISGWTDTGCDGKGSGRLVRDAQHSTDGFWTIDLALEEFSIGDRAAPGGRFLRVECEPGTAAHRVCADRSPRAGEVLVFGGPIVVDTDGPFLEGHPDGEFEIIEGQSNVESRKPKGRLRVAGLSVVSHESDPLRHCEGAKRPRQSPNGRNALKNVALRVSPDFRASAFDSDSPTRGS